MGWIIVGILWLGGTLCSILHTRSVFSSFPEEVRRTINSASGYKGDKYPKVHFIEFTTHFVTWPRMFIKPRRR
jgi:hypothetical protein